MQKGIWSRLGLWAIAAVWAVSPWVVNPLLNQCAADTAPPAKGTISGRVLTGTGEPLRRVAVVLEEAKYADGSGESVANTTTGDNGEFSFSDLSPARYRLEAEKSGYVAGRFPRTKAVVSLNAGDVVDDVTLRLVPVSVVSGYVLDGNGDPLAKAVIRLLQYKYYPGVRRLTVAREAISDERGEYRMGDLNPGSYYAVASYRSRISDVVCPPVYYPDVASFDDATPVRLSPGGEAPIKFVLLPGKPVQVRGIVTGRGAGVVHVLLVPRGGVPYAQPISVETSNGAFEFKNVLPGDYTIVAKSETKDEILEGRSGVVVTDHDRPAESVQLNARVEPKQLYVSAHLDFNDFRDPHYFISTKEVVISLHPALTSNEDSVLAAEKDLASEGHEISIPNNTKIDLPYPGPFIVSAKNLPGDFYIEGADSQDQTYRGQRILGVEYLTVHLNFHGGSVEGIVVDSDDHPLPGAVVVAAPYPVPNHVVGPFSYPIERIDQNRVAKTDQYGHFILHGLAPTSYGIYAWEDVVEGAYYDPEFLKDYGGSAVGVNVGSDRHYEVKLHAASSEE